MHLPSLPPPVAVRSGSWRPSGRLATIFLVLALATAACGGTGSSAEEGAAPEKSTEESASEKANTKPVEISFGERVELVDHLVEGEITVFDFTSPYCGPCRQLNPWLELLHRERDDLSVVKVNINRPEWRGIDFRSPVARQYGLLSIPAFIVYDAEGKVMVEGDRAKQVVIGWLQELARQQQGR